MIKNWIAEIIYSLYHAITFIHYSELCDILILNVNT